MAHRSERIFPIHIMISRPSIHQLKSSHQMRKSRVELRIGKAGNIVVSLGTYVNRPDLLHANTASAPSRETKHMVLEYGSVTIKPALGLEGVRRRKDGGIVIVDVMGERYACLKFNQVSKRRAPPAPDVCVPLLRCGGRRVQPLPAVRHEEVLRMCLEKREVIP